MNLSKFWSTANYLFIYFQERSLVQLRDYMESETMNILLCLLIFILISCNFSEDGGRWPSKHVRFVYAELKSCVLLICFYNLHIQSITNNNKLLIAAKLPEILQKR